MVTSLSVNGVCLRVSGQPLNWSEINNGVSLFVWEFCTVQGGYDVTLLGILVILEGFYPRKDFISIVLLILTRHGILDSSG